MQLVLNKLPAPTAVGLTQPCSLDLHPGLVPEIWGSRVCRWLLRRRKAVAFSSMAQLLSGTCLIPCEEDPPVLHRQSCGADAVPGSGPALQAGTLMVLSLQCTGLERTCRATVPTSDLGGLRSCCAMCPQH